MYRPRGSEWSNGSAGRGNIDALAYLVDGCFSASMTQCHLECPLARAVCCSLKRCCIHGTVLIGCLCIIICTVAQPFEEGGACDYGTAFYDRYIRVDIAINYTTNDTSGHEYTRSVPV